MTSGDALLKYTSILKDGGIDEAADEAKVLLCHVLGMDSSRLFACPEQPLDRRQIEELDNLVQLRLQRVPSAYLTHSREFYGMQFYVDPGVLIPRPETETLVEAAIGFASGWVGRSHRTMRIADVGTGSGAVAIAIAASLPDADVYAADISDEALKVAGVNVQRHHLSSRVSLIKSYLLQQTEGRFDLVVANLPYIAQSDLGNLPEEIRNCEPGIALDGGPGGTGLIRELIVQSMNRIARDGAMLFEIGAGQEEEIQGFAAAALQDAEIEMTRDLAGINRVIKIVPHVK